MIYNRLLIVQFIYTALRNPVPQLRASYLSRLVYFWADSLLWRGFRNPLTNSDLWDMDPVVTSRGVVPQFDKYLGTISHKMSIINNICSQELFYKKYKQFCFLLTNWDKDLKNISLSDMYFFFMNYQ